MRMAKLLDYSNIKFMRKEYLPAILLYIASAILYVSSAIMFLINNYHWATLLVFAILIMLLASSRLVKIGNRLRKDEEREEKK